MGDLAWYIPVLIFCARIADVSIGTIRMIFVIAGWRYRSAALGFVEVLIWALAIGGLIQYITQPLALLSYCSGFAAGNLVGMMIEQKLALGTRVVQVINRDHTLGLPNKLREAGYRVTCVDGKGRDGPVEIVYTVVRRRVLPDVLSKVETIAPQAIVTVERAEHASATALGTAYTKRWLMIPGVGGVRK